MARVLVVDDENLMRTMVEVACRRLGHEALCAATLAEGRRLAAAGVDVILLDMLLPDGNGLDAQQELAALPDAPDIVVITGHGDGDAAEKALRGGVWDFLMKPVRVRDVEETLSHVLEARDRRRSRRGLELEPGQVAGSGPAMQAALAQLEQAAHSDVNVLLLGETGVGKEQFARFIYENSQRSEQSFISINCGAIPPTLIESELFGYERGAFTGAKREGKMGVFESADNGTVFLDEIGDLPLEMQVHLLRVLQEMQITRVGGTRSIPVNVRIIAATNRDLLDMVHKKTFREDLYYRLNVIPIEIPPLRERPGDVVPLVQTFLRETNKKYCFQKVFSPAALQAMQHYNWPGNVRELKNVVEQAVILSDKNDILPSDLPIACCFSGERNHAPQPSGAFSLKREVARFEYQYICQAYEQYKNVRDAAASLGMDGATFVRKRKKYEQMLQK